MELVRVRVVPLVACAAACGALAFGAWRVARAGAPRVDTGEQAPAAGAADVDRTAPTAATRATQIGDVEWTLDFGPRVEVAVHWVEKLSTTGKLVRAAQPTLVSSREALLQDLRDGRVQLDHPEDRFWIEAADRERLLEKGVVRPGRARAPRCALAPRIAADGWVEHRAVLGHFDARPREDAVDRGVREAQADGLTRVRFRGDLWDHASRPSNWSDDVPGGVLELIETIPGEALMRFSGAGPGAEDTHVVGRIEADGTLEMWVQELATHDG